MAGSTADQEEQDDAVMGYAVRRAAMAPASAEQFVEGSAAKALSCGGEVRVTDVGSAVS